MTKRKLWIRFIIVLVLPLLVWVFVVSSRQIDRNRRIEQEVAALEQEAEKIRRENETLGEKIAYFSSQDFREQEAKKKLGLQKEGEMVVVIQSQPKEDESSEPERIAQTFSVEDDTDRTQFMKWWRLFFGKQ